MKTIKEVEIEVCENCGNETRPHRCARCHAECCDRCSNTVRVAVDLYTPQPKEKYGYYSIRVSRTHENQYAHFCVSCSEPILKFLTENDFVKEVVKDNVAED